MLNRRDAVGGLLMMMAAKLNAEPQRWNDNVFSVAHGTTTHEPFGDLTIFHQGPTEHLKDMVSGCLVLKPGQEPHPPHQHPEEEFMLVTEGGGEILVNGKTSQVGPGSLMYCQGNRLHGIKNTGTAPLRFYYFKWLAA